MTGLMTRGSRRGRTARRRVADAGRRPAAGQARVRVSGPLRREGRASLPTALLVVAVLALLVAGTRCGTTLPLESYETATDLPTHPTVAFFEASREEVWRAIVQVLQERDEDPELLDRERGRLTTGWEEAPSLIHYRRRLGDSGEDARVPLPARYRLLVRVSRIDERTRVEVTAEEETNFLILTGTDPQTGRSYYRDRWEPTATRTQREHRWLEDLREELGGADAAVRRDGAASRRVANGDRW